MPSLLETMLSFLFSLLALISVYASIAVAFTPSLIETRPATIARSATTSITQLKASKLPPGISPFEKSVAKSQDLQGTFRTISQKAILQALNDGKRTLEVEFPPLLGGDKSKTQFDDFDNVQELNKNQDWCVQLAPLLSPSIKPIWLIFPDLKECELAKEEWTGQRYRQAGVFTCIEAVTDHYSGKEERNAGDYSKPWGASFASGMNQLFGGESGDAGLLGDKSSLDPLEGSPKLHIVCQPGNGGPVEDWINVAAFHSNANGQVPTIVVNGALDKVRDGYYAPFIFPKLAATQSFYNGFESVFFLKPVSDKGVYGWVYRVYPEKWQVILQTPVRTPKGDLRITETVALMSDKRPTYAEAVQALLTTARTVQPQQ